MGITTACSKSSVASVQKLHACDNKYNYATIILDGHVYAAGYLDDYYPISSSATELIIDGKPYRTHPVNILFSWEGE